MRPLFPILLSALLVAQEPVRMPNPESVHSLDLRTDLGKDPAARIRLVPPGTWDGLVRTSSLQAPRHPRQGGAGSTVEVWDVSLSESPRQEVFRLYLGEFRASLNKAMADRPSSHHAIELSEIMLSDPSNPQELDLTKVQSLQNRFNSLPPAGSPRP